MLKSVRNAMLVPARPALFAAVLTSLVAGLLLSGCETEGEMRILDVEPRVGHTQGDQTVRIIGQNFRQDIGYTIYFGTKRTETLTIRNPETIEVTTPSQLPKGPVDIMIRADDGNAFKIAGAFNVEEIKTTSQGAGAAAADEQKGNLKF